jgi:hypothetical protein
MLSSFAKHGGDVGDNLMNFFKEVDQKCQKRRFEEEIRSLHKILKSVKLKEDILVEKLSGKCSTTPEKRQKLSDDSDSAECRAKMELYKICHGVTGLKHEPGTGKLIFVFHPVSYGKIFGPYQVSVFPPKHGATIYQ